jgi:predicted nucleotidyltransferase
LSEKDVGKPLIELAEIDRGIVQTILRDHVPELEVWAFGSRATHSAKPYSDLDLALITTTPLPLSRMADLNYAFESSDLPIKVDVVDWATTSSHFRGIISANKVVIQSRQDRI